MSKTVNDTPAGLRGLLGREHRELNQLFVALLEALQADARNDALRLWSAFDDGLSRHMALEEEELLPLLREHDAGEVAALLTEHAEIRAKLSELGIGIELHEIRVQTVADFIEQLRRHADREDALAYRWAQAHIPAEQGERIQSALAAARALRQKAFELGRKLGNRVSLRH